MSDLFFTTLQLISPDVFFLCMIGVAVLLASFSAQTGKSVYYLTQLTLLIAFSLTLFLFRAHGSTVILLSSQYVLDPLALLSKLSIYFFSFFAFAYANHTLAARHIVRGEYYLLGLLAVFGMSLMASAYTFLTMYLGLELLSLTLYAMIALEKESSVAAEAAMKYFVLGSMASGFLLYGISIIFGLTGSIQMNTIFSLIGAEQNVAWMMALIFILGGLLFKFGAFPFHMWVPDVYQGSATPTTLFIASAPKIAAFAITIRILTQALPAMHVTWEPILTVIAILSMFFGNLLAMVQTNLKRLLAYSSIAHVGYLLLGVIAGPVVNVGYQASLFYMLTYALIVVGTFAVITLMSRAGIQSDEIEDYRGLNARNPWLAFLMLILLFSLAGIPPTVGFIAKFSLLQALVAAHLAWLALLALFFALIGAYYYIRIVMLMYFKEPSSVLLAMPIQYSLPMNIVMSVNGIAALMLGIFPNTLLELCRIFGV